jgi:5-dehydro-2-deoxygluconokinase
VTDSYALVVGRACVDLYADELGIPLSEAERFNAFLGGSPANIAAGIARLGASVRFATRVGADSMGAFVRRQLEGFGIDVEYVHEDPEVQTSVVLGAFQPPEGADMVFYRDRAADLALAPSDLSIGLVREAALLVTTGTALSAEPSRSATIAALTTAAEGDTLRAFVIDHRPPAWRGTTKSSIARRYRGALQVCDVAIGNAEEISLAAELEDWRVGARAIAALGPSVVVVTLGSDGALVFEDGRFSRVPSVPASPVNVVGAGDAFAASFFYGLLTGHDAVASARLGTAAGAIVVERLGCSAAMPSADEVADRLAQAPTKGAV